MSEQTPFVRLKNVNKIYPNGVQAVFDFNLDINQKEFVILVGPSGCGKSTTLRMVAGLEDISSGEFYIGDELANFMPSKDRHIAMVFQSYALYPNMTVFENMAFGLKIQKLPQDEIEKRVFEAAKILDLGKYLDRKPKELSGGQMQRVALGRAIVRHAPIFLMDEPLSNLDAKLRVSMRTEIVRIHEQVGSTTIYVTHDQVEAMTMATKIVVMNQGFVQQIGSPEEIYQNPVNSFVASFIGTPSMNLFRVNYENGELLFTNNLKLKNPSAFKEAYEKYLNDEIASIQEVLTKDDHEVEVYLKRILSNKANIDGDKGNGVIKLEKKANFFVRFANKFKKKNKEEKKENVSREELTNVLNTLLNNKENKHEVLIGIRPEKIKLRKLNEGESEEGKLVVVANACELLGSEYNIHFDFEGKTIVGKMNNDVKVSRKDKLVLDIKDDDFYAFSNVTGKSIF